MSNRLRVKLTEKSLAKVGVELCGKGTESNPILRCAECGQVWSLNFRPGGGFYRGWWKCPKGCNEPPEEVTG